MKKFLLVAGVLSLCATMYAAEYRQEAVLTVTNGIDSYLDKDKYQGCMTCETTETTAKFTLFDGYARVYKEFTISGLKGNPTPEGYYGTKPYIGYIEYVNTFSTDCMDIYASQTIFNKDDNFEVIIAEWNGSDYDVNVYSETGEKLGTLPRGDADADFELFLTDFGEELLFSKLIRDDESGGYKETYYKYVLDGSGVEKVEASKSVTRAYPNPLPSGRRFTIELDAPAAEGTTVSVVDMSGKTVYKGAVPAGSDKAFVPSSRKLHGSHIFVVECNGSIIERGKLVAQ